MILGLVCIISGIVLFIAFFFVDSLFTMFIMMASSIVLAIVGGNIYANWCEWNDTTNKERPVISYRTFWALYKCDPNRWDLSIDKITYRYQSGEYKKIDFKTYYDYLIYSRFYTNHKKLKKEMKQHENQAEFIKQAQLNISVQEEQNNRWLKERLEKIVYNQE